MNESDNYYFILIGIQIIILVSIFKIVECVYGYNMKATFKIYLGNKSC